MASRVEGGITVGRVLYRLRCMIPAWGYNRCPPCTFRKLLG